MDGSRRSSASRPGIPTSLFVLLLASASLDHAFRRRLARSGRQLQVHAVRGCSSSRRRCCSDDLSGDERAVIRRAARGGAATIWRALFHHSIGAAGRRARGGVPAAGLARHEGTLRAAGALNLFWPPRWLTIARAASRAHSRLCRLGHSPRQRYLVRLFLVAAFITGAASFIYEIAWIRCSARARLRRSRPRVDDIGLHHRAPRSADGGSAAASTALPTRCASRAWCRSSWAAALATHLHSPDFRWMATAMRVLQRSEEAYPLFNLFSHAIAFSVMLPRPSSPADAAAVHARAAARREWRACDRPNLRRHTLGAIAGVLMAVQCWCLTPRQVDAGARRHGGHLLGTCVLRYSQARSAR